MRAKLDADFNLEVTKELVAIRKEVQKGKKFPVLMDTRLMFQVDKESSQYGARKDVSELSTAMAILAGASLATKLIGNFFIRFNKPFVPTRIFKSEKKAIEWLDSFK